MASASSSPMHKWGICATGKISNDFASCLLHLKNLGAPVSLHAVAAGSGLLSAQNFQRRFDVTRSYGSYAELFQDPEVSIVYIGAIHPAHHGLCLQALSSGKHVVCEKPIALNLRELEEIQECARRHNRFLLEGMWTRFFPAYREIRRMVLEAKTIGEVKLVQADFGVAFGRDNKRIWDLGMGGGALLDVGCYPLAHTIAFLGVAGEGNDAKEVRPPLRSHVQGALDPDSGVDAFGTYVATYPNSAQAVAVWSGLVQTPETLTIVGTEGSIVIESPAHCPTRARISRNQGRGPPVTEALEYPLGALGDDVYARQSTTESPGGTTEDAHAGDTGKAKGTLNFPNSEGFVYEIDAVMRAIDAGELECPEYTWAESRAVCAAMDAIRGDLGVLYPADKKATEAGEFHP